MRVREATIDDVAQIVSLARMLALAVSDPDPGEDIGDLIEAAFGAERWSYLLVAEQGAALVGFAAYSRRFETHRRARSLWLSDLAVAPGHRGQGTGRALLAALQEKALELGAERIVFDLWVENDAARSFYEALGARRDGEIEVYALTVLPS